MKCARCNGEIPEGSRACPGCGLKVKVRQLESGAPPASQPLPPPSGEERGFKAASLAELVSSEPYSAPGEVTFGETPPAMERSKRKSLIPRSPLKAIIIVSILLVAIAAGLYFLVLNQPWRPSGPEDVVIQFFKALSSGDSKTMKSLVMPDSGVGMESVDSMSIFKEGTFKLENPMMTVRSESGGESVIDVYDIKITVSMSGKTVTKYASEVSVGSVPITIKLKSINGEWRVSEFIWPKG